VSEQLHDIIRDAESQQETRAFTSVSVGWPDSVPFPVLNDQLEAAHRKQTRSAARQSTSVFARTKRKWALAEAAQLHSAWIDEETARLVDEHTQVSALVSRGFSAWQAGEPIAVTLVANAFLAATGRGAFVVEYVGATATVVVFGPSIDEVHPDGPSWTPSGAKTVKRRSKKERAQVHLQMLAAETVGALSACAKVLPTNTTVSVALVIPDAGSLALDDAPVVAWFEHWGALPTSEAEIDDFLERRLLAKPQRLSVILPRVFEADPRERAVAVTVETIGELQSPLFWVEIASTLDALNDVEPSVEVLADQVSSSHAGSDETAEREESLAATAAREPSRTALLTKDQEADELFTELDRVKDAVDAVTIHRPLEEALRFLAALNRSEVSEPLVEVLFLTAARCALFLIDSSHVERLLHDAERLDLSTSVLSSLRSADAVLAVDREETYLRQLLSEATTAVDMGDGPAVTARWMSLVSRLPAVVQGADDEAEDVARSMMMAVAALRARHLLDAVQSAVELSVPSVQQRFTVINVELDELFRHAEKIVDYVKANRGITQSAIGSAIEVPQPIVRHICWYLSHFGQIDRVKKGSSYQLFLPDDYEEETP